ncbi:D-2-hydroxyacid dehydrogenase [candidate division KSB1 bacterium]|nr:D-2-hydroxyacid dehydrogenase [candidate division KSB1 bacterium]RQW00869.1 MAG: D-2-hydroxyacid dehydrogenase [candidate division KSB1 bacterium]
MHLVVLDGYTMNPGDLSWEPLHQLADCQIYARTPEHLVLSRGRSADLIITNKVPFYRETLKQLPLLKYIGVSATGYNIIDTAAASELGIAVTNVPAYSTMSVAQMVFAHILNLTTHVAQHAESVRRGKWVACQDFSFADFPLIELDGLVLGIIGLGRIGRSVAQSAHTFGMQVIFYEPQKKEDRPAWTSQVDVETLFATSDIITLHCPLTDATHHIVNRERLALMKKDAFLINTGRGPLIDEQALADALNRGMIAGAGLDVLSHEPPRADNPLLRSKNCYITPHNAWATRAARQRLLNIVVDNIKAFLDGKPKNIVQ